MYYLKEAADLGQQDAQEELATAYNSGTTNKNRFFIMPH
jgi:TPR repeat protein